VTVKRREVDRLVQALRSWEEGLARLGECIVQFQRIEDAVSICISAMIGRSRQIGRIVTAEMSFRTRVATFGALFQHLLKSTTLPPDVVDLIGRLHWAEQERNTLVHSLWDASESRPDSIVRSKRAIRKQQLRVAAEHLTPDSLEDLNRLLEGVVTDLIYLTSLHLPQLESRLLSRRPG
jgi:hypothetical protein